MSRSFLRDVKLMERALLVTSIRTDDNVGDQAIRIKSQQFQRQALEEDIRLIEAAKVRPLELNTVRLDDQDANISVNSS